MAISRQMAKQTGPIECCSGMNSKELIVRSLDWISKTLCFHLVYKASPKRIPKKREEDTYCHST